jgi:hypothetical protein
MRPPGTLPYIWNRPSTPAIDPAKFGQSIPVTIRVVFGGINCRTPSSPLDPILLTIKSQSALKESWAVPKGTFGKSSNTQAGLHVPSEQFKLWHSALTVQGAPLLAPPTQNPQSWSTSQSLAGELLQRPLG